MNRQSGAASDTTPKMKISLLPIVALCALASSVFAADYQVTGVVKELTDAKITVTKGKENFEMARTGVTLPADVKVGSKVTVYYSITATKVESKEAAKPAPAAKAGMAEKPAKAEKPAAAAK